MRKGILIIVILLMVLFIAGCIEEKPKMNTYNGNGMSFQYPEGWSSNNAGKIKIQQENLLVDLESADGTYGVFIYKENLKTFLSELNMSYDEYVDYNLLHSNGETIYNKTRDIGGINALEFGQIFLNDEGNYYVSTALIKKDKYLYTVLIFSLDNNQYYVDNILNSFKFT